MKLATLCYVKDRVNSTTLMLHRVKKEMDMHRGKWNGLGGKFEPGESPEECVIREILEESGLQIQNPKLHGFITFPAFDGVDDWYVFIYSASEFTGTLIDSPEGHLHWVKDEELLQLNLWEGDKHFMKWVNENRFFSAKFVYKAKSLVSHTVIFH